MISWINLTIFAVSFALIVFLIILNIIQKQNSKKYIAIGLQLLADKKKLLDEVNNILSKQELENTDGFVKFISESRDWAFQYIENVQSALEEFNQVVYPELDYHKKYGGVLGETSHSQQLTKISEAYDKLKTVLPENKQTPNN